MAFWGELALGMAVLGCGVAGTTTPQSPVVARPSQGKSLHNPGVKQITAAGASTCALWMDGSVLCWGADARPHVDPLGLHLHQTATVPYRIQGLPPVVEIGSGCDFSGCTWCGRASDGRVWCWGSNEHKQLGRETLAKWDYRPMPVWGIQPASRLFVGAGTTCVLSERAEATCWGRRSRDSALEGGGSLLFRMKALDGVSELIPLGDEICGRFASGRLLCLALPADGSGERSGDEKSKETRLVADAGEWPSQAPCFAERIGLVRCAGRYALGALREGVMLPSLVQLAVGARHACALDGEGRVLCWGANDHGQLGMSSGRDVAPDPMAVEELPRVSQVVAGSSHTCALTRNGRVWCWGSGQSAQLGTGVQSLAQDPRPARVGKANGLQIVGNKTCVASANQVWCSGFEGNASCGVASFNRVNLGEQEAATVLRGGKCTEQGDALVCKSPAYLAVSGPQTGSGSVVPIREVVAGKRGLCVVLGDGTLACQGRHPPKRFERVVGVRDVLHYVERSEQEDACVLEDRGKVRCRAQGGDWTEVRQLEGVRSIALGHRKLCGLSPEGYVQCMDWTPRYGSQGEEVQKGTLQRMPGLDRVTTFGLGKSGGCALHSNGKVLCFGERGEGSSEPLDAAFRGPPHTIALPSSAKALAVGLEHACATLATGQVRCWGHNELGQLGDGSRICEQKPVDVTNTLYRAMGWAKPDD